MADTKAKTTAKPAEPAVQKYRVGSMPISPAERVRLLPNQEFTNEELLAKGCTAENVTQLVDKGYLIKL